MKNELAKILVTGASGKIGSRLVSRLINLGYPVKAFVRNAETSLRLQSIGAELVQGDLQDLDSLKNAIKDVDVVIHLAMFYNPEMIDDFKSINLKATETLAKSALESGAKQFIFASSNYVYGSNRGKMVTEDDETKPEGNIFGELKVETENSLLNLFKNTDVTLCILRLSLVYGDGDGHVKETIAELSDWAPAKRLQMVHYADVNQSVNLVISQKSSGIFNVTDDVPLSISELRKLNHVIDTKDKQINDNWEHIVSNLKIKKELGFRPIYPTFYSAFNSGTN